MSAELCRFTLCVCESHRIMSHERAAEKTKRSEEREGSTKDSASVLSQCSVVSSSMMTECESLLNLSHPDAFMWLLAAWETICQSNKASFSFPCADCVKRLTYFTIGPRPLGTHSSPRHAFSRSPSPSGFFFRGCAAVRRLIFGSIVATYLHEDSRGID